MQRQVIQATLWVFVACAAVAPRADAADILIVGEPNSLAVYDISGAFQQLIALPGSTPADIDESSAGEIFIGENGGSVERFDAALGLISRWSAGVGTIYGLGVSPSDTIFVAGSSYVSAREFTPAGVFVRDWTPTGGSNLRDMCWDTAGNLWLANFSGSRANVFDAAGVHTGDATTPGLSAPFGITRAPSGELWIADQNSHQLFRFDAARTLQGSFNPLPFTGQTWNPGVDSRGWIYVPERSSANTTVYNDAGVYQMTLSTAGLTAPRGVLIRDGAPVISVLAVDTTPTSVAPGAVGIDVAMTVENLHATEAIDMLVPTLTFTGTASRTAEYTVTPAPGNPTSIAALSTALFDFTVTVSAMATEELVTLDGGIQGRLATSMTMASDATAQTTDSWTVIGARPIVRTVAAQPTQVVPGTSGHRVDVTVENVGLTTWAPALPVLSFTGTADRTSEYMTTLVPGVTSVAPGATESFAVDVDVAPGATLELITIDVASFFGIDIVTTRAQSDTGADVTDTWTVIACAAMLCGDCDLSTTLTILDALKGAQIAAGLILAGTLTLQEFEQCDADDSGVIGIIDALVMAQAAAGLPVTLSCC